MLQRKREKKNLNHPSVFVSFFLLICSQGLLVLLERKGERAIEVYEKQMDWLLEPNGKQRSFNSLGNSGRNVTSFGAQSADGSIS